MTAGRYSGQAVVVGGTGAVGSAVLDGLRQAGLAVVAVARDAEALAALASGDEGVRPCSADIGSEAAQSAIAGALFPDLALRMVVQAAGLPSTGPLTTIDPAALGTVVSLKLGGLLRLVRAVDERLEPGARIVAIGGHFGSEPSPTTCAAGVTNAALANLVRQLADAYGPRGVTVHMIAPGPLDTPRLRRIAADAAHVRGTDPDTILNEYRSHSPLNRLTTTDEVGWAVTQLLAPQAVALHGASLALDGGARRGLF
ncbi:SDR family oxidoreductase [Mycobacterium marseillense]|uniref:SDR family NAD(P)-dependent oxidoreductase n=1 Tax=Mycobacterium marseillense TaxID=701042 RepID=UPI002595B40F|nr:SDR family oxidoreductase [Mycobacterium marseillense]MDM3975288.1 SDR family oxidoreductase [Mycobacterium marseillense]